MNNYDTDQIIGYSIVGLLTLIILGIIVIITFGYGSIGDDFDYPDGVSEEGIEDMDALLESHQNNLSDKEFTIEVRDKVDSEIGEQSSETTFKYDGESIGLGEDTQGEQSQERYEDYEEQVSYIKSNVDGDESFTQVPLQTDEVFTGLDIISIAEELELELDEITTEDGENVAVFTIVDINDSELQGQEGEEVDFEASGEMHVSENGYVTYTDLTINENVDDITIEQEFESYDIDNTTVEEPDWLETAMEEAEEPEAPEQPPEEEIPEEE